MAILKTKPKSRARQIAEEVKFEDRWMHPEWVKASEAEFSARRAATGKLAREQRITALKKQQAKLEKELRTPWSQREKNKGASNLALRAIALGLDIATVPFWAASKTVGLSGSVVYWANRKLFGKKSAAFPGGEDHRISPPRIKGLFPSVFAERRALSKVRKKLRQERE